MRRGLVVIAMCVGVAACAARASPQAAAPSGPRVAGPIAVAVTAAWTSLGGLSKIGSSGDIDGTDHCNTGASLPAVAVPADPGFAQTMGVLVAALHGGPPLIDTTLGHSSGEFARNVQIDWRRLIDLKELAPDFLFPRDSAGMPAGAWFASQPNSYPTILIENDTSKAHAYMLTGIGRGLLMTTGDLMIRGRASWSGLILVGGTLTFQGSPTIDGAVVTGLNVKLGYTVPVNRIPRQPPMRITYNSCTVKAALARFSARPSARLPP